MQVKNILLVQTAFIGDVILTTPMIVALKKALPQVRLSVLLRPEASVLLQGHSAVAEVMVVDKKKKHRGLLGMMKIIKTIRKRQFDVLLSPHKSHRTAILSFLSRVPLRIGYAKSGLAWLGYHQHLQRDMSKPEIDRLLDFLKNFLVKLSEDPKNNMPNSSFLSTPSNSPYTQLERRLSIQVTPKAIHTSRDLFLETNTSKAIIIAPSSVWPTKRWLPGHFAVLIGKLLHKYPSHNVFLVGDKKDQAICKIVLRFIHLFQTNEIQDRVHDTSGTISLDVLYAVLQKSSLLVSNDSAPVHLACAAGTPVVAIFGPTVASIGYAPLTPNSLVVEKELGCRPCGLHGHYQCPEKHFRCMKEISPLDVMNGIQRVI